MATQVGSIYFVINKATGTAMTLNLEDRKTVTGNPRNGQDNQRWKFIKSGDYWVIQSVATDGYLDVVKHGPPVNNDKVVAIKTDTPLTWDLRSDGTGDEWHIFFKDTDKNIDLAYGKPDPNTPIIVFDASGAAWQTWRLEAIVD